MEDNVEKKLVEKILKNIPVNLKPADYLMEILNISRNSAYRRLKGEKSFTFQEVLKLSSIQEFSIDEISASVNNLSLSNSKTNISLPLEENLFEALNYLHKLADKHKQAKDSEIIITINQLIPTSVFAQPYLFRFLYYKWMHQTRKIPMNYTFSQITVPSDIISLTLKYQELTSSIKNVSIIIYPEIFQNIITDIQYFYKRKLVSDKELKKLKTSLRSFIRAHEIILQKIPDSQSVKYDCYLSSLFVASNTIYSSYDGIEEVNYWPYSINPITITSPTQCKLHKGWCESLKRYSTLITAANEMALVNYMSQQYEYIENMDKII